MVMRAHLSGTAGAVTAAAALAMLGLAAPGAAATTAGAHSGGTWGQAHEVLGALAWSGVVSVSCASPGSCSAGGYLLSDSRSPQQAMVVSEKKGAWGKAEVVPGSATLNTGGQGLIFSVSCASPGNCSAGGTLDVGKQAFVVDQKNGHWGTVLPIPGMGEVDSLSCASAGNCSAGGGMFAVSETNGTWGTAEQIPGLAAVSAGGQAFITSVSCASAGNCSAGGYTASQTGFQQEGFVVSQHNGTWGTAQQIPGLAALNRDGSAQVRSVSCASADNCSAGGYYLGHSGFQQGFVVTSTPAPGAPRSRSPA